jgi:hypothetical protein
MSFLGSFNPFNIVKSLVQTGLDIVQNPAKGFSELATTVVTGGASLVSPQIKQFTDPIVSKLYDPALIPLAITATTHVPITGIITPPGVPKPYSVGPQPFLGSISYPQAKSFQPQPFTNTISEAPMGLNLGNLLSGGISAIGTFLGGGSASQALQGFTSQAFLPTPTAPTIGASPFGGQAYPTMASVPAAARAVATVGRSFFAKYPNLATVIQGYRNMGKNVTRAKLYSLLKRFGPDLLISGGILTAAAVSELMVAGPGRRRMNPGNVKALRRSLRRLESFHHLCQRADKLRRPRGRTKTIVRGGRTQEFIRQG